MKIYLPSQEIVRVPQGRVRLLWGDKDGNLKEVQDLHNLITLAGRVSWAKAFRGETSNNQGIATYHALGTDDTAPDINDTTLGAELFRKLISVRDNDGITAQFQTFFTTAEANGTLKELGLFGDDATGTADSGTLFAKLAIDRVKTSNDTLTVLHNVIFGG